VKRWMKAARFRRAEVSARLRCTKTECEHRQWLRSRETRAYLRAKRAAHRTVDVVVCEGKKKLVTKRWMERKKRSRQKKFVKKICPD
jgi:hypothetical protein